MNQEQDSDCSQLIQEGMSKSEESLPEKKLNFPISHYQDILYSYCKEKYPKLIKMAKLFIKRAENNYDNQIAIEGVTGSGKSMFTLIILLLMHKLVNLSFNIRNQTLFIPDDGELRRAVHALKPLATYWIDEAIRALDKKRWYNQEQIDLNHIIKTERWKRNTLLYCMPDFRDFTNSFRTSNIFFRVYIIPRFAAVLRVKDLDPDIEDPWHTKQNRTIKFGKYGKVNYNAVMMNDERLEKEKKLPNYYMDTEWPNLEEHPVLSEIWQYYLYLKEKSRENDPNALDNRKRMNTYDRMQNKNFTILVDFLGSKMGMTPYQVHKNCNLDISYTTFRKKYQIGKKDIDESYTLATRK